MLPSLFAPGSGVRQPLPKHSIQRAGNGASRRTGHFRKRMRLALFIADHMELKQGAPPRIDAIGGNL